MSGKVGDNIYRSSGVIAAGKFTVNAPDVVLQK